MNQKEEQKTRRITDAYKIKIEYLQKAQRYKKKLQEVKKKKKQQEIKRKRKELFS